MAHTPGPWQWGTDEEFDSGSDLVSLSVEEEALAGEDGAPFPKWLHICTNSFDLGNPDDLPLIAAAPDLLAALRGLLDAVQTEIAHNDGRTGERGDMDAAMKVSEQVLAKAKRRGA